MASDIENRPHFSLSQVEQLALAHFGITGAIKPLPSERDLNFRIVTESEREDYLLKIANPNTAGDWVEFENQAIALAGAEHFPQLRVYRNQARSLITPIQDDNGQTCQTRLLSFVPGQTLAELSPTRRSPQLYFDIGRALALLDQSLKPLSFNPLARREFRWDLKRAPEWIELGIRSATDNRQKRVLETVLERFREVEFRVSKLPCSVIHNDANDHNVVIQERNVVFIDFGDLIYSQTIHNLAICCAYIGLEADDPLSAVAEVVCGYDQVSRLGEVELSVLFPLMMSRLGQSVSIAREQQQLEPDNEYLSISSQPAWDLLSQYVDLEPEWARMKFADRCLQEVAHTVPDQKRAMRERRARYLGPSLSLSYDRPLHLVSGQGQYLFDAVGAKYLDCVNNVCHVGHSHPAVIEAASQQWRQLNTNTRYLHDNILDYAERLVATLPAGLDVCYFVNSGSEANDLALRMARAATGNHDVAVLDHAYHGHTTALIELSPYKFRGPGGNGKASYVHVFPAPDAYRLDLEEGVKPASFAATLAQNVIDDAIAANDSNWGLAAFFAESLLGCGGQVPLPQGYLRDVYPRVRELGAVCVADEVQVGFGRVGAKFWGFELQGVVPDIVTMGKPIGNGHPLAAVVTTRKIADAFHNGMEYFNTFGGNPVSCAVGLAVLDVIEREGLQENARIVGDWILQRWRELQDQYAVIGNVRGVGFYLGLEVVLDRETKQPGADLAHRLVQNLREENVLLSTDGPFHNVIKFKPPMVFDMADAERLVMAMERQFKSLT